MSARLQTTFRHALVLFLAFLACGCALERRRTPGRSVEVWLSSRNLQLTLSQSKKLALKPLYSWQQPDIHVDPLKRFQKVLGLGSSLEHATCYNLSILPPSLRRDVLRGLLHPHDGIGMNLMRICMGTPDFTGDPWYTYNDRPAGETDPQLEHFSIERDRRYVLPVLKEALKQNPDLLFQASPWSPPGWMTTTGDLIGGHVLREHYAAYARYFVRFVEAYEQEGVRIHAVTVQNEPGVDRSRDIPEWHYPSCGWTAEEERDFIRDHLGPAFRKAGLETQIWCYDHNFNVEPMSDGVGNDFGIDYPTTILADPQAASFVDGVAFHGYEGEPEGMSIFRSRFPEKPIYFTEGSVFGVRGIVELMRYFHHGASSYTAWVTLLDENHEPNNGPFDASSTCIMLDTKTKSIEYRYDYYFYGQIMKFVERDAVRLDSSVHGGHYGSVAFENPDGTVVLVVANPGPFSRELLVREACHGEGFTCKIPGESVATFLWEN